MPPRLLSLTGQLSQRLLNCLAPPVCLLCQRLFTASRQRQVVCDNCMADAFPATVRCQQCGLALGRRLQAFGWTRCRHCRAQPSGKKTWVAGDYIMPFDAMAKRLKFGNEPALALAMGQALAERFRNNRLAETDTPDVLIPVPVSHQRLRERGYNQALLIARALGHELGISVWHRALIKTRETGRQAELSAQERMLNLQDAFQCSVDLTGLHIGLVDDVMTTGATLDACEITLTAAGAACTSRWIALRTPEKPEALPE